MHRPAKATPSAVPVASDQGKGVENSSRPATVIGTKTANRPVERPARHCPTGREGAVSRRNESQETCVGSANSRILEGGKWRSEK